MRISRTQKLKEALTRRELVRIKRKFEDTPIQGYVLAVGPKFFVVELVNDRLWLDGFECFRIADLISIELAPYAEVVETALKKRGQRYVRLPRLRIQTIQEVLESSARLFPIVAIHREQINPDVCHIGQVIATNRSQVALLEIGPNATWDTTATVYKLREITRVNFGGSYEEALHLVGGFSATVNTMPDHSHFDRGDALEDQGHLERAFLEFTAGAEAGDVACMTRLALMYTLGKGVGCCDYDKAIEWETKAHVAGYPMALFNLGITHRLKGDLREAKACFESALAAGDTSAALELAKLYLVSSKEVLTVKKYLNLVLSDDSLCESELEEARELLSEMQTDNGLLQSY